MKLFDKRLVLAATFAAGAALSANADAAIITYTFDGATTGAPDAQSASGATAGNFAAFNPNGNNNTPIGTTSASSGYAGASGDENLGVPAKTGPLDITSSSYYSVTLTPASGSQIVVSDFNFGTRSTSTGPTAFSLRSSINNFASDIATGTITANSTWQFKDTSFAAVTGADSTPVELRLYVHSGTGSAAAGTINSRIDDITLDVTSSPVPEPASLGLLGVGGLLLARRRRAAR